MDVLNHIRPREAEQLVVALDVFVKVFETFTPILRLAQFETLNHRAHCAIKNGDALFKNGR